LTFKKWEQNNKEENRVKKHPNELSEIVN